MSRKLLHSIRWKLLAGRFGQLVRDAIQLPYVYDGTRRPHRRVFIGQNVNLSNAVLNTVSGDIRIGDDSFFGHGVSLLTGTHDYTASRASRQTASPSAGRDITVGRGVWIASNATVLGPCAIGDDAVVAAGAVVTMREVPAGAIVGGMPARIIGHNRGADDAGDP